MIPFLLPWLLAMPLPHQVAGQKIPSLDLTPLKAPLERVAMAVDKAFARFESLKSSVVRVMNWTAIAAAVALTMILMHTFHLHGLAASKSNLHQETDHP